MKLFKKLAATATALVMAVGMMSVGASASTPYNWKLNKPYGYPSNREVTCKGEVSGLTLANDDAIDFYCSTISSHGTPKFDIEASFKLVADQYAFLYYAGDTDSIKFHSRWWIDNPDCICTVYGMVDNDTSTTYTATGTAK